MPSFTARLADGWEHSRAHLQLALVPLLSALLDTNKITSVLATDGTHFGLRLGLPASVVDLWQFVSVPNDGVSIDLGGPLTFPLVLIVLPIGLAVRAGLAAGYFGSIRDALDTGSYDFAANVRRYFVPFLLYTAVPVLLLLPLVLVDASGARGALVPLFVLLIPVIIVAAYLFYATPYLVILRETDLVTAARTSYGLALDGGPYFHYAVGFAAFVLLASVLATPVVANLGLVGIALGVVVMAPVGLAANVATMRFVAEIDPGSPSFDGWGNDGGAPTGTEEPS